ncbi:uncharacterized protein LOC131024853 isoform X4 [Salvia miltiorrhiza]|uniref:uncharacterized protein LOC131024853 isoform X4 n=1 Tax=Salvia miltiorrhiza TaxID=226208 RepID=UPI0025AC3DEB|nr:uncharacterized protein LOC131024853 isoform X4 [Salvia miltiorrhiza]
MQQPLQEGKSPESINATILFASLRVMLLLHLTCGLGLALAFWVAVEFCSLSLIQNPAPTLFIVWAVDALVVIPVFSQFRLNPDKCSYVKAIVRGLMGLPAGALVNALGAIVLGAPVGIQHFKRTVNWSLLMSVFTFVPAASVFGSSWTDWHRIFAHSNPNVQANATRRFYNLFTGTWSYYRGLVWCMAHAT